MNTVQLDLIEIGKIIKPFGIKGEMKVLFYIDEVSDLQSVNTFYVVDKKAPEGFKELKISSMNFSENPEYARVIFTDIIDRTDAEKWRSVLLYVEKSQVKSPREGEYFIRDLLGLKCFSKEQEIGTVSNIIDAGGQDVFIIKLLDNQQELAVPFDDCYVSQVCIADSVIYFHSLEDLL